MNQQKNIKIEFSFYFYLKETSFIDWQKRTAALMDL